MSSLYAPTLKEDPAEAVLLQVDCLLLRAGMIRRPLLVCTPFTCMALFFKIEAIIRDEMDGIGSGDSFLFLS